MMTGRHRTKELKLDESVICLTVMREQVESEVKDIYHKLDNGKVFSGRGRRPYPKHKIGTNVGVARF
jgi:hypothetical protein